MLGFWKVFCSRWASLSHFPNCSPCPTVTPCVFFHVTSDISSQKNWSYNFLACQLEEIPLIINPIAYKALAFVLPFCLLCCCLANGAIAQGCPASSWIDLFVHFLPTQHCLLSLKPYSITQAEFVCCPLCNHHSILSSECNRPYFFSFAVPIFTELTFFNGKHCFFFFITYYLAISTAGAQQMY
jgi:hypothetical protein